jgi:recombination protein RecA
VGKNRPKPTRLEIAVAHINRRFGPHSLIKGRRTDALSTPQDVPHISTGFPDLDRALGTGGLPRGRICEMSGLATSGKTTLAIKFLAQAQDDGGQVAYVDHARYFDPDYAHRCGLDLARLVVGEPDDLEEALSMVEALARSGGVSAIVLDLMDFVWQPASVARFGTALRRLLAPLARTEATLLVLHAVPATGGAAFVALAHYATVRLHVARERWLRRHGDVRGYEARVAVVKNKLGPSGRSVTLSITFNGVVRGDGL